MAGIKGRIKRAQRDAQSEGVVIRLRDGTTKIFSELEAHAQLFLMRTDTLREERVDSELLNAVRAATPESRAAFEEEYGPITYEAHIIAGNYEGAWVEVLRLEEDGTVTKVRHEGGAPEAERLREEARNSGPAF
jgi:hypothetical protein